MSENPDIDTLILGCTHYPILLEKIEKYTPSGIKILPQGKLVAESLADYLYRHPEIDKKCTKTGNTSYLTTENTQQFNPLASFFMNEKVEAERVTL